MVDVRERGRSKVDIDTTDVKLLLEDGREIPARFVLRDHDLDLAFVLPGASDLKLPYISLDRTKGPSRSTMSSSFIARVRC